MKRLLCVLTSFGIAFALALHALAALSAEMSTKPFNWYCKHMKDDTVPPCDPQMKFIEKYGGYYVDRNIKDGEKIIYLTFDVGYENGNVEKIVDTMKEKNVTGAFFVLENFVKTEPELIKKIASYGNLICNHTASHKDMTKVCDKDTFEKELSSLEQVIKNETGLETAHYYRPPEGRFNEQNIAWANELGYSTIFWSFGYVDWDNGKQPDKEKSIKKIMQSTHNGEIILLHPTSSTNAAIIGELIDRWREDGYTFGTLDELVSKGR